MGIEFIITNILLGAGLAMDAFSVSLANGLNEPGMKRSRMCGIAGVFAFFQWFMPLVGWICVHTIIQYFNALEKFIPWIALILLLYIGGSMLIEGIKDRKNPEETEKQKVGFKGLIIQGIATSIDALSVGVAIADYNLLDAFIATIIIAIVTFIICMCGLVLGKTFGTKLSWKASVLGGVILIGIGLEIFISGVFF